MISTQRKNAEIRQFNKKNDSLDLPFYFTLSFFIVSEMQTACGKTLHSRLFLLDKAEKATHFRRFFKKKALHNCIICAVQLWQSTLQMIQCNHLVVPFLCRVAVSLYDFLDSGCIFRLENTTTFLTIENNTQEFRFENLSHLNYTQTLNKPYSFRVRFT